MDADYAARYRTYYERHWWWRARESYVISQLRTLLDDRPDRNILDVGCGDGLMFEALSTFGYVEGVEVDATIVSPTGPWASRISVQPFDDSFDDGRRFGLILMLDSLEHMTEPERSLRQAVALLDDDGVVVVTVPAFNALWTGHDEINAHVQRFSRASLGDLADRAGGRMTRSHYFFQWLTVAKVGVRVKETLLRQYGGRQPGMPPKWANSALIRISRLEQQTVSRLPLPFGSSLFAVIEPDRSVAREAVTGP
jgi:SAM-dependent methyltransferase